MKKDLHIRMTLLAVACALSTARLAHADGGGSTGGGFSFLREGSDSPITLDLAEIAPQLRDEKKLSAANPVILGRVGKRLGYELRKPDELPCYPLAERRIALWEKNSPQIAKLLQQALKSLRWRFSDFSVPRQGEQFVLPPTLTQKDAERIKPVIAYDAMFGVLVDTKQWNKLGDSSQAALMIHEAFRQIQLAYQKKMSTQKLQQLTATILLRNPEEVRGSLESSRFLDGQLLQDIENRKYIQAALCKKFSEDLASQDALAKLKLAEIAERLEDDGPPLLDATRLLGLSVPEAGERMLMDYIEGKGAVSPQAAREYDQAISKIRAKLEKMEHSASPVFQD